MNETLNKFRYINKRLVPLYTELNSGNNSVLENIRGLNNQKNEMLDVLVEQGYTSDYLFKNVYDYTGEDND